MSNGLVALERPEITAERVLAPVPLQQFLDVYWGKRHLVVRRNDSGHYGSIFRFADVDRYLALAARHPEARLQLGQKGVSRKASVQEVEARELYAAVSSGATVLLESIDRCWPAAAELALVLSEAFSARVKVNVYMTPAGYQGAPLHPDIQDVFVLQMEGSKDWTLYEERVYEAVETLEHTRNMGYSVPPFGSDPQVAEQTSLEQGDLLYIPRGLLHRAVAPPTTPSLHLTVCVTPVYWVDFLKAAVEVLSIQHSELGRSLPPGFERDPAVRGALQGEFAALLALVQDHASLEQTAAVFARARARRRSNPADGHFEQLLRADELTDDTVVERRRGLTPILEVHDDSAVLTFGTGQVKTAANLRSALELVCNRERFRVRDLPDTLSPKSKAVLVQRLIREGLLRTQSLPD